MAYLDNKASWTFGMTDKPVKYYAAVADPKNAGQMVPVPKGTFADGTLLRFYKGAVGYPWSPTKGSTVQSPTPDGWWAVEVPPSGKGQVWAGYSAKPGFSIPTVKAQMADASARTRRVWVNKQGMLDSTPVQVAEGDGVNKLGLFVLDSSGVAKQQVGANALYPIVDYSQVDVKHRPKSDPPPKPQTQTQTQTHPESESSGLLYVLAVGAALLGAPVVVPVGLAAIGYAQSTNKSDKA